MKKLLCAMLTLAMSLSLVGCGIGGGSTTTESTTTESTTTESSSSESATTETTTVSYPTKSIEIIVPFGAGGGADISVRLLTKYAEEYLGQSIVIKNVEGGSGTVGITQLAGASNDGYTLGYFASTNSNDNLLFEGITYGVDDFTPVISYAADPHILVASKASGITTIEELVDAAKANPNGLTFGIGGAWTSWDFLKINLETMTDTSMKRMVFQGGADAITSVAMGDCDVAVPFVSEALPQIEAGNVVPIGITSEERFELASDIPTLIEGGLDFTHTMWRGLVAPAGVDPEIVTILSDAFEAAFNDPEYQAAALEAGIFTDFKDSEEFAVFYLENHESYKSMIENTDLEA